MSILFIGSRKEVDAEPSLERLQLFQIRKLKIYRQKLYGQQLKKQIQSKKLREKHKKTLDLQFQRNLLKQYKDDMINRYKGLYKQPLYMSRFKTQADELNNGNHFYMPVNQPLKGSRVDNNRTKQRKRTLDYSIENNRAPTAKHISSFQLYNNGQPNNQSQRINTEHLEWARTKRRENTFDKARFKELSSFYNKKIDQIYDRAKQYSAEKMPNNFHYNSNYLAYSSKDNNLTPFSNAAMHNDSFNKEFINPEADYKDIKLPTIVNELKKHQEETKRRQQDRQMSWRQWFSKQKQHQLQSNYKNIVIDNELLLRRRFDKDSILLESSR